MRKILHSRVAAVSVGAVVVVGLGASGAVAANLVNSHDIRNQSVRGVDIARGAIDTSELRNQSIRAADINNNSIGASELRADAIQRNHLDQRVLNSMDNRSEVKGLRHRVDALEDEGGAGDYQVFTSVQDFGPGGIGGAWCGAPDANTEDEGWVVLGGGAELTPEDVNAGVEVVSSWPNWTDPKNPGWNVQVNKPTNVNPGEVTLYAVCAKMDMADASE